MEGRVMSVSLFETKLQTKKGDLIHIPNSELTKTHIIKLSGKKKKS
jgi:small-conductance mechanosensitive channel